MNTPFLKLYYRQKSTYLTSEQIETIRSLKNKVPKYRIVVCQIGIYVRSESMSIPNRHMSDQNTKDYQVTTL